MKKNELLIKEENINIFRPQNFNDYIGQENIKENLKISINAIQKRQETLDHIIFYGPPGLGKTTLANIIAKELCANIKIISAPAIEKTGDLASILTLLEKGDILFIDEIHRLPRQIEEILYSAMEDYKLDIIINNGNTTEPIRIELEPFTLIGATTRIGMLSNPLRDRFGLSFRMKYYTKEELNIILNNAIKLFDKEFIDNSVEKISEKSRGTPRIGLNLLKRVRDFTDFHNIDKIDEKSIEDCFKKLGIFNYGLDELDIKYLRILKDNNRIVGLKTISSILSEDIRTIEEVIEPFLIQEGLIEITSKGRIGTIKLKDLDLS